MSPRGRRRPRRVRPVTVPAGRPRCAAISCLPAQRRDPRARFGCGVRLAWVVRVVAGVGGPDHAGGRPSGGPLGGHLRAPLRLGSSRTTTRRSTRARGAQSGLGACLPAVGEERWNVESGPQTVRAFGRDDRAFERAIALTRRAVPRREIRAALREAQVRADGPLPELRADPT
jgi:hypothetical protein